MAKWTPKTYLMYHSSCAYMEGKCFICGKAMVDTKASGQKMQW